MASTDTSPPQEVLRWYTRARRIPRLIGKAPGGGHYPGGPYTLTQAGGAATVLLGGQGTMDLWGRFGFWGNNLGLLGATILTLIALRFVKPGGRDPVSTALAVVRLANGPTWGRHRGRAVCGGARRPVQVRHRINARVPARGRLSPPSPGPESSTGPVAPSPAPVPTPAARRPATSVVQQLLRSTTQEKT